MYVYVTSWLGLPTPNVTTTWVPFFGTNKDFGDKLQYLDAVDYAFLEVAPDDGTVYFADPWADIWPGDSFCAQQKPILATYTFRKSCVYAYTSQGLQFSSPEEVFNYGNFDEGMTFDPPYKHIDHYMAIGGYGHDDAFETLFNNPSHIQTFINTTVAILQEYGLTGVDLDYENPNMTAWDSQQYLSLITQLNNALNPAGFKIMVTSLADPLYLKGQRDTVHGFAPGVLATIAGYPAVSRINLMTYDFYGAFNYLPNGTGRTGFISDTYYPNNAPAGSTNFAAADSIQTLLSLGVPASKISGGIPTYGRALNNIDPTSSIVDPVSGKYSGLFSFIPSSASIPGGDLDAYNCNGSISPLTSNSCSGSFTYKSIMNMINSNFTVVDWTNDSNNLSNGTTAFLNSVLPPPPPIPNNILIVSNTGANPIVVDSISNGYQYVNGFTTINSNQANTYSNSSSPSLTGIQGANNLVLEWRESGSKNESACPAFNLTESMQAVIKDGSCTIGVAPPPTPTSNYYIEITNISGVAGGQVMTISNSNVKTGPFDWLAPNGDKIYSNVTNPSISNLQGQSNLVVGWSSPYTGQNYTCPSNFNLTANTKIMVNPETGSCVIAALP
jgi:GH18 family chitinase